MRAKKSRTPRIPGCEIDYWDQLSPEDRRWLKQFNDESLNVYYPKKKKRLHPKRLHSEMLHSRYARKNDALSIAVPYAPSLKVIGTVTPNFEEGIDSLGESRKFSDYLCKKKS